jgi:hypothetical protein
MRHEQVVGIAAAMVILTTMGVSAQQGGSRSGAPILNAGRCERHFPSKPVNYDVKAIVTLPPCTCPQLQPTPAPARNQGAAFTTQPPRGQKVGSDGLTDEQRRQKQLQDQWLRFMKER